MKGKIFLTGDTHIPHDIEKLSFKNWPESRDLTKDDVVIVLGDFGLLWAAESDSTEKYWTKWLNERPYTTLALDGNHENHIRLNNLPTTQMFNNEVGIVSESIFHLKRGNIYTIADQDILCIGGAASIDKIHRTPYISWWPEELLSKADEDKTLDTCVKSNWDVDYVLTHTLPLHLKNNILGKRKIDFYDPTEVFLEEIHNNLTFKRWYFGHYHEDSGQQLNNYKARALYNNIIQIGE